MYAIESFGAITLSPFNNQFTLAPVPPRYSFVSTSTGVFDGDGEGRNRQAFPFPLTYSCVVTENTYNDNRATLDALRAAVGTRARLYRRARNDNSVHFCTARLTAMPHEWPYQQRGYFEIGLEFQQLSPWLGNPHGTGWIFDSGVFFDTGRFFDEGAAGSVTLATSPWYFSLTNNGNLPVHDISIVVRTPTAPLTRFVIYNSTTGCFLIWSGTLAVGGTLIIDSGSWSVTNNGVDNFNNLIIYEPYHTNQYWLQFSSGSNSLRAERVGGDANTTIAFVFNDTWA